MGLITKKQAEIFYKSCRYWIKHFGLSDWYIDWDMYKDDSDHRAFAVINLEAKYASIFIVQDWGDTVDVTEKDLQLTAFHEVCEIMLGELSYLAEDRSVTPNQIVQATHSIIQRLTNIEFSET